MCNFSSISLPLYLKWTHWIHCFMFRSYTISQFYSCPYLPPYHLSLSHKGSSESKQIQSNLSPKPLYNNRSPLWNTMHLLHVSHADRNFPVWKTTRSCIIPPSGQTGTEANFHMENNILLVAPIRVAPRLLDKPEVASLQVATLSSVEFRHREMGLKVNTPLCWRKVSIQGRR